MPLETLSADLQRVVHQFGGVERFNHSRHARITLLHGDNLFDVLHVFRQQSEFAQRLRVLVLNLHRKFVDEGRNMPAPRINGEKCSEVVFVFFQQPGKVRQRPDLRFPNAVTGDGRRHINTVQHVSDVVQHSCCDFSHSGKSGDLKQLCVQCG
jgi:hypothetical protein